MLSLLFLAFSAFLTSIVSGVLGAVGGGMLLGLMAIVVPHQALIPLHALVQMGSNSTRVYLLRASVNQQVAMAFSLGLPLGGLVSWLILDKADDPAVFQVLISLLLIYTALKPKKMPSFRLAPRGFFALGLVVGVLGPIIGASGPILTPFMARSDWTKEQTIATQSICQFTAHLMKLPIFFALGFSLGTYALPLGLMLISVYLGTHVGVAALRKIPTESFAKVFKISMLLLAGHLLYKACTSG